MQRGKSWAPVEQERRQGLETHGANSLKDLFLQKTGDKWVVTTPEIRVHRSVIKVVDVSSLIRKIMGDG